MFYMVHVEVWGFQIASRRTNCLPIPCPDNWLLVFFPPYAAYKCIYSFKKEEEDLFVFNIGHPGATVVIYSPAKLSH